MTYGEELNLIDCLMRMGFGREYITWTLIHCENGCMIGRAMASAIEDLIKNRKPEEFINE